MKKKIKVSDSGFIKIDHTNISLLRLLSDFVGSKISTPAVMRAVKNLEKEQYVKATINTNIYRVFHPLTKWQTTYAIAMDGLPKNVVFGIEKEDYEAYQKMLDPNTFLEEIDKEEDL